MHYYKRNIGDYYKKAGRLTMLQHGAYTLLKDACYDRETFPTLDEAIDWVWAASKEEIEAVEFVLNKFFCKDESGYFVQDRVQEELDKYHENSAINKRIANERETKRREKRTKREQSVDGLPNNSNEAPPNQELGTTNQELGTTNHNNNMVDQEFERFWLAGMTKQSKQNAKKAFAKQFKEACKVDESTTAESFTDYLVFDVQQRLAAQMFGFDKMHPSTYLNQQRWNDDIAKPTQTRGGNLKQSIGTLQDMKLTPQQPEGLLNHEQ